MLTFEPINFVNNLKYMGIGMLGVFMIVAVIVAATYVINYATSKRKNKKTDNEQNGKIEEEFGDLLFSMVNLSRFLGVNAENSLTNATNKFINRFVSIELLAARENKRLSDLTIDEMNELWERVK